MAIMPRPDPSSIQGATFAHTGPERVVEAITQRLREAPGPVSEDVLVTEFGPLVHYTDAARAWMDQYRFRLPRAIRRNPDLAEIDPERAFSVGAGRPDWETQTARYDDGQRIVIVNYILGRRAAFERVTATGQPYRDARGHKLGLVYWRLAAPKPKPAPRPRPARPSVVPVPAADGDIGAITARINGLQHAPLEQGKLLLRVHDEWLYLDLDPRVPDFETYIRKCCPFGVAHAYRLIRLARVKSTIMGASPMGEAKKVVVPENERQARVLAHLLERPEDLRRAWQIAVDTAPIRQNGSPDLSETHIKEVVQRLGLATADPAPLSGAPAAAPPLQAVLEALARGAYDADIGAMEALVAAFTARIEAMRGEGGTPCLSS